MAHETCAQRPLDGRTNAFGNATSSPVNWLHLINLLKKAMEIPFKLIVSKHSITDGTFALSGALWVTSGVHISEKVSSTGVPEAGN